MEIDTKNATTAEQFFDVFHSVYLRRGEQKRARDLRQIFQRYALKVIGDIELEFIDGGMLSDLIKEIEASVGAASATSVRSVLMTFFSWCVEQGALRVNPAASLGRVKQHANDRELEPSEFAALWGATDFSGVAQAADRSAVARELSWACYYRLMLLTGQSRLHLVAMRWSHIDLSNQLWRLPSPSLPSVGLLPLSDAATRMLENFRDIVAPFREAIAGDCVLTNTHGKTLGDFRRARLWLDRRALPLCPDIGMWSEYDLRRTVSRHLARNSAPPRTRRGLLGGGFPPSPAGNLGTDSMRARAAIEAWSVLLFDMVDATC
jgi:integrase